MFFPFCGPVYIQKTEEKGRILIIWMFFQFPGKFMEILRLILHFPSGAARIRTFLSDVKTVTFPQVFAALPGIFAEPLVPVFPNF